ncbi:subclass B3 metallo-beta-lactamase [Hyphococcus sp.]|jgi:metallo-beta-lactamase class B|uniref:subclass B3 metallo-beta-lactamase n=1 Tax=Hyphococcus sp. TaxID=2038636 RepID=UPI003D14C03C
MILKSRIFQGARLALMGLAAIACSPSVEEAPREATLEPDPPHQCDFCERLNEPTEPFRIYGDTYYVGTAMISSVLIASDDGLVLVNGGMTQTAQQIADNIKTLGFSLSELKLIVNTHAHFDHAGGIAALARATGATVATSTRGAEALEQGRPTEDDPQRGLEDNVFPVVPEVRVVADGGTVSAGGIDLTAHYTPAHTPGSVAWTWRSCEDGECLDVVFADSFSTRSAPEFRFTDAEGRIENFRSAIATVAALPCDILLAPSPLSFGVKEKLAARAENPEPNPFIDPAACRTYAEAATAGLDKRIAEEQAAQ